MNKKVYIILLLGLLILFLNFNYGNNNFIRGEIFEGEGGEFGGAGASGIFGITPESGIKLTEKWDYLGKEWKTILMQNSIVKAIDSFLQKISIIFSVLFGVNYSLSLSLFLTVFLWVCLFFLVFNILGYTIFSKWVAVVISIGIAIGAAQIKLFQIPVNLIIGLFFGEKPWWIKLIIGAAIVILILVVIVFIKTFGKKFAESKKKAEEEKSRIKLETGGKISEQLSKIFGRKS